MSIPLYGFMQGDTLGLVILAENDETLQVLAQRLQDATSLRVKNKEQIKLLCNGKAMDPAITVAQAQLQPLDRFDVTSG